VEDNIKHGIHMKCNKLNLCALRLFLLILSLMVMSQARSQDTAASRDTAGTGTKPHSLFTSLGYGTNMICLGSTISGDQSYGYGAVTYGFRNKFYLTASGVHLSGREPFGAFYTGTAAYSHTFNSWFDISADLSGYLVAPELADTLFNSFVYGSITLGLDWRILYTRITTGAVAVSGTRPYLMIRNSRYFETPEFTSKKFYFTFDPYINILAGSMTKAETTSGTSVATSPPYKKKDNDGQGSASTKYTTFYSLIEVDFGLPVSFNAGRFTIEAEPAYILPVYEDEEYPGIKGFNFLLSVYIRIL